MCDCPLSTALLSGILGQGGAPLNISVTVTPSDQVTALRSLVSDLRRHLADLERDYNRVQYLYMCEVQLNLQLQDIMRAAGVSFPRRLCTTGCVPDGFAEFLAGVPGDADC